MKDLGDEAIFFSLELYSGFPRKSLNFHENMELWGDHIGNADGKEVRIVLLC